MPKLIAQSVFDYATTRCLERFLYCDRNSVVEYVAAAVPPVQYHLSGRIGRVVSRRNARRRIVLPRRLRGHVITPWEDIANSVFLNFDLLRQGYFNLHLISPSRADKFSVWTLLWNNLFVRWRRFARLLTKLPYKRSLRHTFGKLAKPLPPAYAPIENRILMVVPSFARGGSERQMLITAQALADRDYQVCLLALRALEPNEPSYDAEVFASGLPVKIVPPLFHRHASPTDLVASELRPYADNLPLWFLAFADGVIHGIRQFRPYTVHCWLDQAAIIGGLAACLLGVPRIVGGQLNVVPPDFDPFELKLYRLGYTALAEHPAIRLVNNSAAGSISYAEWLGLGPGQIQVLPNVFLPTTVRTPRANEITQFRVQQGIDDDRPVVGTMIRFVPQKAPELWVDAAAEISARYPDVKFWIAGYGPLEQAMRKRIGRLGLDDRVKILGPIDDIGLFYASIDVFMLSSRYEGLPYTLIEAQAAGRPVVATHVGGNAAAFVDGVTGHLVHEHAASALATAVIDILDHLDEWKQRVAADGPAFVQRQFGLDQVIDLTLDIYGSPRRYTGGGCHEGR